MLAAYSSKIFKPLFKINSVQYTNYETPMLLLNDITGSVLLNPSEIIRLKALGAYHFIRLRHTHLLNKHCINSINTKKTIITGDASTAEISELMRLHVMKKNPGSIKNLC